ncbi:MAG: hypothetical protein MZW92_04885 [Comamonadaceae bacterium]|nr:hypothetical protein [Comamonadaceae bacterium]
MRTARRLPTPAVIDVERTTYVRQLADARAAAGGRAADAPRRRRRARAWRW